jgi:hypothetical protein
LKTFFLSNLVIFLALAAFTLVAQEEDGAPPDVQSLMTEEDFTLSGLDKLNDEERAHLNEWLEKYRQGAITGPKVEKPRSQWTEEEKEADKNFQIAAKVVPSFRGWRGKTVFRLDNGQIWQQRMSGSMNYSGSSSEVVITKNMMGRFVLRHIETDRSVLVKRVE